MMFSLTSSARLHDSRNKPRLVIEAFSFSNVPQNSSRKQYSSLLFIKMRPQDVYMKFIVSFDETNQI